MNDHPVVQPDCLDGMDLRRLSYANATASVSVVLALATAIYVFSREDGDAQPPADLAGLSQSLALKDFGAGQEGWINLGGEDAPPLNHFEEFFVPPHSPPAFMKDREGFVHLRGLIAPGNAVGSAGLPAGSEYTVFTLPLRFRPAHQEVQGVLRGDGQVDRIDVRTNGEVVWGAQPNGGDLGPSTFLTLDGVTFRAAR